MTHDFTPRARRGLLALAAAALTLVIPAVPAQAKILELGQTAQSAAASCPGSPCLAVSRTTGYQIKVGEQRDLFIAPARGRIVAWTISLGSPNKKQRTFFNTTLGGEPSAGISIVRPRERLFAKVLAHSPIEQLRGYYGETVQFPLERSLPVRKGDAVALTVPTWAPALAVGFGNDTSWRATRAEGECADTETPTAQTEVGVETRFRCLYRTARLTYTATLITTPKPKKTANGG